MVRHQPESPEQLRAGASPDAGYDQMRSEGYPMPGRDTRVGYGGGGSTAPDLQTSFQQVFGNLQQAEQLVETQGVRAALPAYAAAIQAADSIDQQAVAQEKAAVQQQLQSGQLDQQTAQQLQQQYMNLDTLQRAPGVARANLGLLFLRNGMSADGVKLLLEAEQMDPRMKDDPNFQRHLQSALAAGQRYQPQQPGQGVPGSGVPAGSDTGAAPPSMTPTGRVADNTGATTDQTTVTATDQQGHTPWQLAQQLLSQVTGPQSMTPQMQQQWQQVINASDHGTSPRVQPLYAQFQKQQSALQAALQPISQQLNADDQQILNTINQQPGLTDAQKQQAAAYLSQLGAASSQAEYQQMEQALLKLVPNAAQGLQQRDQLLAGMGANGQPVPGAVNIFNQLFAFNSTKDDLQAEIDQAAMTRYACAQALLAAGDAQDAKAMMAQALLKTQKQNADGTSTDIVPEETTALKRAATVMGVTNADLQAAQQALQQQAAQAPGTDASGARPVTGNPAAPAGGDATAATPQSMQLLQQAETAFNANPDHKAALTAQAPVFQQAIAAANADFQKITPQQLQQYQQTMTQLNTLDQQLATATQALPQADQTTLVGIMQGTITGQQAQQWLAAHPQISTLVQQEISLVQSPVAQQVQTAMDAKVNASAAYAQAMMLADPVANKTQAANVFNQGLAGIPQAQVQSYLSKPDMQALAKQIGVTLPAGTPVAPGAPAKPGSDAGAGAPATGAGGAQPGDASTGYKPTGDAQVDQIAKNSNYNFADLVALAEMKVKDGVDAASPYYKAALACAESTDPKVLADTISKYEDALKTGQYTDSTGTHALTPDLRQQAHQTIAQLIQIAQAPMAIHEEYALMLKSAHRFKDASDQLDLAVKAADNIPVDLVRTEIGLMNADTKNTQLPELYRAKDLVQGAATLQNTAKAPVAIREAAAAFYLAGGKNGDGSPINDQLILGYDQNGQPVTGEYDTKVLDPKKASDLIQQAVDLQQKNGVDLAKHPELDQNLAALRQAALINAPDKLKKQLEHASHYWDNASSSFWSTAAGLTVAAGILLATRGEGASLIADASAPALLGAGAAGFATSTVANMGMQHLYYHRNDWSWGDAALYGGGTFAVAGAALFAQQGGFAARGAQFTAETTGNIATKILPDGTVGGVGEMFKGAGYVAPKLPQGLDIAGNAITDATKLTDLTAEQAGGLFGSSNAQRMAALFKVMPQGVRGVDVTADAAGFTVEGTGSAAIKALGPKASLADVAQLYNKAGMLDQAPQALQDAMAAAGSNAAKIPLASLQPAEVGQFFGADAATAAANSQRMINFYSVVPKAEQFAASEGLAAAQPAGATSLAGRTLQGVRSVPGAINSAMPWSAVEASGVPTSGAMTATRFGVGGAAALTYTMGNQAIGYTSDYTRGESKVKPWDAMWSSITTFRGPFMGINPTNPLLQAIPMAMMLGSIKVGAPLYRSPGEIWNATRTADIQAGKSLSFLHPFSSAWQLTKPVLAVPGYEAKWGAEVGLGWLNPPGSLTGAQALRQTLFLPTAYMTGQNLGAGYMLSKSGQPWSDALQNINRPITNEQTFNPPTLDANGDPVAATATPAASTGDSKAGTPQQPAKTPAKNNPTGAPAAPGNAQPGPIDTTKGPNAGG